MVIQINQMRVKPKISFFRGTKCHVCQHSVIEMAIISFYSYAKM